MKRIYFISASVFILLLLHIQTAAQNGKIIKENGEPYEGIPVVNGKQKTVTGSDGSFALDIKQGDTLLIKKKKYIVNTIPFIITVSATNHRIIELEEVQVSAKKRKEPATILINHEILLRNRGTSNADVFNGEPGLLVNNIRNEAGGLDIGIRGLQGDGRVPILIDGGLQSTQTFRGYQGSSDRTYIEMDLIKNIEIAKGAGFNPGAIGATGGVINMTTIGVEDIVLPGNKFGAYIKGDIFNNNKTPDIPASEKGQQYYIVQNDIRETQISNGKGTIAVGYKTGKLDFMAALSGNSQGNYFAGKKGAARYGYDAATYDASARKTPEVKPGQEVVNTSYSSGSALAKLGWAITPKQRLEIIYRYHGQQAGEVLASYWYKNSNDSNFRRLPTGVQSMPQWSLGTVSLNTYSLNYRYHSGRMLDLAVSLFTNNGNMQQRNGLAQNPGARYGDQYLHNFRNSRKGGTVYNSTSFDQLLLALKYGLTIQTERLEPLGVPDSRTGSARNGRRNTYSGFLSAEYQWKKLQVQAEIKIHGARVHDFNTKKKIEYNTNADLIGRISYAATGWLNIYAKISSVNRTPSLYESTVSSQTFSYDEKNPLKTERASSYETGLQVRAHSLLGKKDTLLFNANIFYNNSKNYISAAVIKTAPYFVFLNYDQFRLKGAEFSFTYETSNMFLNGSAIFYSDAKVCSKRLADEFGYPECNAQGFDFSVLPNRIPAKSSFSISTGAYLLNKKLTIGGRVRYHSRKDNPENWLQGTGAAGIAVVIPADHSIDVFSSYKINRNVSLGAGIDNLTDRYQYDIGTILRMPVPGRTIRVGIQANF